MKTTNKNIASNSGNSHAKSDFSFGKLMGGEFLLSKKVIKWYPYFLLLFLMMVLIVANERSVANKQDKISDLSVEYKDAITKLKKNNQFIPYDQNQLLLEKLKNQGFNKYPKQTYKIIVKTDNE